MERHEPERAPNVAAVREGSVHYRRLFTESPLPKALARGCDGVRVECNEAYRRLFELSVADSVGKTSLEQGLADLETLVEITRRFAEHGSVRDFQCTLRTMSGRTLVALVDVAGVTLDGEEFWLTTVRDVTALRRAEEAARLYEQSRERLLDLEAIERLHHISSLFLRGADPRELLERCLDAAIAITEADLGNIQVVDPQTSELRIVVQRGFSRPYVDFWDCVARGSGACGTALLRGERVIVEDVTRSPIFEGEALQVQFAAGVRGVQSTPLRSRSGAPLGAISTHFVTPRRPSERSLRFLDVLVREVADLLERSQAEAALRISEAKATAILATSADAIVSVDAGRRVVEWNHSAERMFGYSREEAMGMPLEALLDGASAVGLRRSGDEFPIAATISRFEVSGETFMTVSVRDATEERRNEAEQRTLADLGGALASTDDDRVLDRIARAVITSLAEFSCIFVLSEDGNLFRAAAASRDPHRAWIADMVRTLPGPPRASHPVWRAIHERKAFIVAHPEQYAEIAESEDHLRALQSAASSYSILAPFVVGDLCLGALALSSTTRQFDERDVRLAEEAARRCAYFMENMRLHERERRALRVRDEVLGIVAHDLRSPLASILVQMHILQGGRREGDRRSPKVADAVRYAAERMNRLIQDLLDVTLVESGKLVVRRDELPAGDIVAAIVATQREAVASSGLELRQDVPRPLPLVRGDKDRLLQILENLVGNAMKFTQTGHITIGAEAREHDVVFRVADTGIGIAPEALGHVFDRFWQKRRTTRDGLGLGLGIVKGLVEAHGGQTWVESRVGVGSTFFFSVPRATP
jgi:signal transduction histidine kinase/PAS domain-containing protein